MYIKIDQDSSVKKSQMWRKKYVGGEWTAGRSGPLLKVDGVGSRRGSVLFVPSYICHIEIISACPLEMLGVSDIMW